MSRWAREQKLPERPERRAPGQLPQRAEAREPPRASPQRARMAAWMRQPEPAGPPGGQAPERPPDGPPGREDGASPPPAPGAAAGQSDAARAHRQPGREPEPEPDRQLESEPERQPGWTDSPGSRQRRARAVQQLQPELQAEPGLGPGSALPGAVRLPAKPPPLAARQAVRRPQQADAAERPWRLPRPACVRKSPSLRRRASSRGRG